jgi:hypothetical protein
VQSSHHSYSPAGAGLPVPLKTVPEKVMLPRLQFQPTREFAQHSFLRVVNRDGNLAGFPEWKGNLVRFCCDVTGDRNHQTTERQFLPWIRCHRIAGRNAVNADGGRGTTWIICILSREPMVQSLVTSSTISKLTPFEDTRGAGPRATGQMKSLPRTNANAPSLRDGRPGTICKVSTKLRLPIHYRQRRK